MCYSLKIPFLATSQEFHFHWQQVGAQSTATDNSPKSLGSHTHFCCVNITQLSFLFLILKDATLCLILKYRLNNADKLFIALLLLLI